MMHLSEWTITKTGIIYVQIIYKLYSKATDSKLIKQKQWNILDLTSMQTQHIHLKLCAANIICPCT